LKHKIAGTDIETEYDPPQLYGSNVNGNCDREVYNSATGNLPKDFYTTDRFFADDLNLNGQCSNTNTNKFLYATFQKITTGVCMSNQLGTQDKAFISEDCWSDTTKMRFQKFVHQDIDLVNDDLSASGKATQQVQKECVVATCNNNFNEFTGTADDKRMQSEWNVFECNQQRHTGICRIRAFGCEDPTFTCKENYSRSCGDRSVYKKEINQWLNNEVETKIENLPLSDPQATTAK